MRVQELELSGLFSIDNFQSIDSRGLFVKTFNSESFELINFSDSIKESYYSKSNKGVLRGMHFQLPPFDHEKIIYVTDGVIKDVILDLRTSSKTFGKYVEIEMYENEKAILIPKGCAHGFLTISNSATVVYNVTSVHVKESDSGIHWNSFGYDWKVNNPIISERDNDLTNFKDFISPFN